VLNVTAVAPDRPGYLTVYPRGETPPLASSVNFLGGDVVPNAVLAQMGADGHAQASGDRARPLDVDPSRLPV
jgi:hypothetical protein